MNQVEYERRKRAIEEQYLVDLELIRAAYQARLRALETLRLAPAAADRPDARSEAPASAETQNAAPDPDETLASAAETQNETPVSRRGDVLYQILATFPHLPDDFDKADVVRLLGYEPTRGTLHRAWDRLREENKIVISRYTDGRRPTRFRKLRPE
ncbi:MAG TPA: hypothetical protein VGG03_10670 [Thermoanaerobaculia bacterium]|jgi:hypothetical protein